MIGVASHKRERARFRWPWQPRPGHVRMSKSKLIELLRANLRCAELEAEAVELQAERARYEAESADIRRHEAARRLVGAQTRSAGVRLSPLAVDGMLASLPTTIDGELHVEAFLALLGQHILEQRLSDALTTTAEDHRR